MEHPLHLTIGEIINSNKFPGCKIVKDPACGGNQNIPLFCENGKSNETEYCNVDILILKKDKIQVIIEIDESTRTPTQICGKFLTSVLSSYYNHTLEKNKHVEMSDSCNFVQIVKNPLQKNSSRPEKWEYLEKSIKSISPIKNSKIKSYHLIYGNIQNFENSKSKECLQLIKCINEALI